MKMNEEYLKYDEIIIENFTEEAVNSMYNNGYLFGRRFRGDMYQSRSLRIDLEQFEPNSENRRILRKNDNLKILIEKLPISEYSWKIHKMGKEFYESKFGEGTMSASKINSMFQNPEKNNQTHSFEYMLDGDKIGYCLSYLNQTIVHYSYPFYSLDLLNKTIGIAMMTKAIIWAKENNLKYFYLGTVSSPDSRYKLQFKGLEWWDIEYKKWNSDIAKLKELLK